MIYETDGKNFAEFREFQAVEWLIAHKTEKNRKQKFRFLLKPAVRRANLGAGASWSPVATAAFRTRLQRRVSRNAKPKTRTYGIYDIATLQKAARDVRKRVLRTNARAGQGHTGGDLSETDILVTLFFHVLNLPGRTRGILIATGHSQQGARRLRTILYAGDRRLIDEALLDTYLEFDSPLPGHPVRQKTPFIELNTGALGHGMAVAAGLALAAKRQNKSYRVFVLVGDGELQEGSNWEAAMSAAQYKLDNLTVIVDRNRLQLADRTESIVGLEPLGDKWRAFGFELHEARGNDIADLIRVFDETKVGSGRPHVILAHTTKGSGVSFIEDRAAWHHRIPSAEELELAMAELDK